MKIEHIAVWTKDLERSRDFYTQFFMATAGDKYENKTKGFSSYFLSFKDGARLEIMTMESRSESEKTNEERYYGISHFAVSVGDKQTVDQLTETLRRQGVTVASEPRTTGDGYYESVVLDPDGNRIEITV